GDWAGDGVPATSSLFFRRDMSSPTFTQHPDSTSSTAGNGQLNEPRHQSEASVTPSRTVPIPLASPAVRHAEVPPSGSLAFIEQVYTAWQEDPTSVSPDWREYFEGLATEGKCPLEL